MPRRVETLVQLTDDLIALLDAEAARRGESRSAVVREAVMQYLAGAREAAIDAAIVDGYRRIPQATPDAWGDLSAEQDARARELGQRLDGEEPGEW